MLSKFFAVTVFIVKCDRKTSHTLYEPFWKKKCDKRLLQSESGIRKCDNYYIVRIKFCYVWGVSKHKHFQKSIFFMQTFSLFLFVYILTSQHKNVLKNDNNTSAFVKLMKSL